MTFKTPDRVAETCSGAGTGPLALTGAPPANHRALAAALDDGDTFPGVVVHRTATEWQSGIYQYSDDGSVELKRLHQSSTGAAVSFSAGVKDIKIVALGRIASPLRVAAAFDALPWDRLAIDTSSGEVTVDAPAIPSEGDTVWFSDYARSWDTNNFILDGNGTPFAGGATSMRCSDPGDFYIRCESGAWQVVLTGF